MSSFLQFQADFRQAKKSNRLADWLHRSTATIAERRKLMVSVCKRLRVPHPEDAGLLLEDLTYRARVSTALCGAWDSAVNIALRLDWTPHKVRRERNKLKKAGLISTTNGRPVVNRKKVGRTCLHYRLTDVFEAACVALCAAFEKVVKRYRRRKQSNVVATVKPTRAPSQVRGLLEAKNLGKTVSDRSADVAKAAIGGLQALLRRSVPR